MKLCPKMAQGLINVSAITIKGNQIESIGKNLNKVKTTKILLIKIIYQFLYPHRLHWV